MFLFNQKKNDDIHNLERDIALKELTVTSRNNSYVSNEILENEIFNNSPSYSDIPSDLDIEFAKNLSEKTGKFVYCSSKNELKTHFNTFLNKNQLFKPFIWEEELNNFMKENLTPPQSIVRVMDEASCAVSLCEYLIADEGSIIINPNQNRFRPLDGFPEWHIILASKSQLRMNLEHAVSDFLIKYPDFFPFVLNTAREEKPTRFASNKPVLNSRGTKKVVVFYCEEPIL